MKWVSLSLAAWNTKGSRTASLKRRDRRVRLNVEALEDRLALSTVQAYPGIDAQLQAATGILSITGNASNESLVVDTAASAGLRVTLNGTTQQFSPGAVKGLRIDLGGGTNTVVINATPAGVPVSIINSGNGADDITVGAASPGAGTSGIAGPVSLQNLGGHLSLNVDDTADRATQTVALWGNSLSVGPTAVQWSGPLSSLALRSGSGSNTINVQGTPAGTPVSVFCGTCHDTVNVRATSGPVNILNNNHNSSDGVNVGSLAPSLGGSLSSINGPVNVSNSAGNGGRTDLTLDDSADRAHRTVAVSATGVTGLSAAAITFDNSALSSLMLRSGSGSNTINVQGTPAATPVSVYCGTGYDTVNVRATSGPLNVVNNHPNTFDAVNVGSLAPSLGGSLSSINGSVNVSNSNGYGGRTDLTLDDSGDRTTRIVGISASGVTSLAPAPITYSSSALSSLTLQGGLGGDTFNVLGTPADAPVSIFGGTGRDAVNITSTSGPLTLNGSAGRLSIQVADGNPNDYNLQVNIAVDADQPQDDSWSCGPNSASRVLRAYGYQASYNDVRSWVRDNDFLSKLGAGSSLEDVRDVMRLSKPDTASEAGSTFDRIEQLLLQGKPIVALVSLGSAVKLDSSEWGAAGSTIGSILGGPIGAIVGGIVGVEDPLNFPHLHYITLTGIDIRSQTLFYVDTNGSRCTVSFADFQRMWNWTPDPASMAILAARGVSPRSIVY